MSHNLNMKSIPKYLKTAEHANRMGCSQRSVHRNFHLGRLDGYQDPLTRTIYSLNPEYDLSDEESDRKRAILYVRVSSSDNKASLEGQIQRLRDYCAAKGYTVIDEE